MLLTEDVEVIQPFAPLKEDLGLNLPNHSLFQLNVQHVNVNGDLQTFIPLIVNMVL